MTERELERRAQRCLAVLRHGEEVSFNVAASCRYGGISRQCQQSVEGAGEGDGFRWANNNMNVVPSLLLNPFVSNRRQIWTDFVEMDRQNWYVVREKVTGTC